MNFLINPWFFLFWALGSWLIGMLGRDTRFGFAGNFLVSFLFSPVVGVIVLLAADQRKARNQRRRSAER